MLTWVLKADDGKKAWVSSAFRPSHTYHMFFIASRLTVSNWWAWVPEFRTFPVQILLRINFFFSSWFLGIKIRDISILVWDISIPDLIYIYIRSEVPNPSHCQIIRSSTPLRISICILDDPAKTVLLIYMISVFQKLLKCLFAEISFPILFAFIHVEFFLEFEERKKTKVYGTSTIVNQTD